MSVASHIRPPPELLQKMEEAWRRAGGPFYGDYTACPWGAFELAKDAWPDRYFGHAANAGNRAMETLARRFIKKRLTPGGTAGRSSTKPGTGRETAPQSQAEAPRAGSSPAPGATPASEAVGGSPSPAGPATGAGVKFDQGKDRWGLFPWRAARGVLRVLMKGAEKYTERDAQGNVVRDGAENWRKVPDLQKRYLDAAIRHLVAVQQGEWRDPETDEPHVAHAACCVLFLLEDHLLSVTSKES